MGKETFRSRVLDARPDARRGLEGHDAKRNLALALRALRKKKRMTQKDVEQLSGLSQPAVSRLEAPTGAMPTLDTVMRYVAACDSHMLFSFSEHAFGDGVEEPDAAEDSHDVITAVAV